MARIDTPSMVITRTAMADKHAAWNWSVPELVGHSVRTDGSTGEVESPIAVVIPTADPRPTGIRPAGLIDVSEKAVKVKSGYAWGHQRGPFALVGPRMFAASRGHFVPSIIPRNGSMSGAHA
jgi:hypothetical protein